MDLNALSEQERKTLIRYLKKEYLKNPDQFPFPKETLEELMQQWSQLDSNDEDDEEEGESVNDIKSKEMIIEDAQQDKQMEEEEDEGQNEEEEMVELTQEQLQ